MFVILLVLVFVVAEDLLNTEPLGPAFVAGERRVGDAVEEHRGGTPWRHRTDRVVDRAAPGEHREEMLVGKVFADEVGRGHRQDAQDLSAVALLQPGQDDRGVVTLEAGRHAHRGLGALDVYHRDDARPPAAPHCRRRHVQHVDAGRDAVYASIFENVTGSIYNDTLTGDAGDNVLDGGKGNDTLEGGAGKDVAARALHRLSFGSRCDAAPYVAVNCAAVPADMFEAELFGAERGAYTGADKRRTGLVAAAQNGTLFLDEVGDMPMNLQAKLLRVLENNEVFRIGSNEPLKVNVRVVSATHRDLEAAVAEGTFRQDLYFRLNRLKVKLPPLRQRREDIPLLAAHFIKEFNALHGKSVTGISEPVRRAMALHEWPGNVRELENLMTRAMVLTTTDCIRATADGPKPALRACFAAFVSGSETFEIVSNRKLNVAIVGLGFGAEFIPLWQKHPHTDCYAICQRNEAKLKEVGDYWKVDVRYTDYAELLKDPKVDAVHINSPIPDHAWMSIAALKAGKHVACTVPMATNIADCKKIVDLAKRTGLKYMMMETVVYAREYLFMKSLLDKGELGKLQFVQASHQQDMDGWPNYWPGLPPMWYATHCVGPVSALVGAPAEYVSCFGSGRIAEDMIPIYNSDRKSVV